MCCVCVCVVYVCVCVVCVCVVCVCVVCVSSYVDLAPTQAALTLLPMLTRRFFPAEVKCRTSSTCMTARDHFTRITNS